MIRLQVPGALEYRDIALRVVSAACKLVREEDVPASTRQRFQEEIVSAFGEAFNNVAIHGYRGRPTDDVEVTIDCANGAMTVELRDYGHSFNLDHVPPPVFEQCPEGGFGVFIMRSFVDKIEYSIGKPNVLRLTKFFRPE